MTTKTNEKTSGSPERETTQSKDELYRQKYINCRTFARSFLSIHQAVLPAYEAYLLLNPSGHSLLDRPGYYRPQFVAVARSAYVHVVAGFPDYRLLPTCGRTQISCFVDKLPEPDARDLDLLLEIAWHHVLSVTPWRALSNQLLGTFYRSFFHAVPESVLTNHGCFGGSAEQRHALGPKAFGSLSGISRKTLSRLCGKNNQAPIAHVTHEALIKKHNTLQRKVDQ